MKMMIVVLLAVSAPVFAEKTPASFEKKRLPEASTARTAEPKNFKISFRMKADELDAAGNFVVADGSQGNYIVKTTRASDTEKSKDGRSQYGGIVNCIPTSRPGTQSARLECQFELSGTAQTASDTSLQLQTTFDAFLGKTLVLVDEPTRHIEIEIETLAP